MSGGAVLQTDDTIVAVSTAAGAAPRGIVRLSGPDAVSFARGVFSAGRTSIEEIGGFRTVDGLINIPDHGIELPGRAYVFRGPRSYTRQDVVELHTPGSPVIMAALLDALICAGARQAAAGEFTARAFFSGRLDLSAAEAVADIIDAADDAHLRSAMATLGGRVHRLCSDAAATATECLATIEASIDLADENIRLADSRTLAGELTALADRLHRVAAEAGDMPETARAPVVVLAGRANVGKSSLLNALTGADRAIVSALAGTTRDVLSAAMTLDDGTAMTLQDAAGFMYCDDPLEAAAHGAARAAVARADCVLFVVDASADDFSADSALLAEVRAANHRAPVLMLANKCDCPAAAISRTEKLASQARLELFATSAVTGEGLHAVKHRLAERLHVSSHRGGEAIGLHERQRRCLASAADSAVRAAELLREAAEIADVAELAAVELRAALAELGQISGQVVTEDILGRIFARFCVGK